MSRERGPSSESKPLSEKATKSQFIAIAANTDGLFALDNRGWIWKYYPYDETRDRYAFWGKLTSHRAPINA